MAQQVTTPHFIFDEWSRGASPVHRLGARCKLAGTLALLVLTAVWPGAWPLFALALPLVLWARLPLWAVLLRAALVLPFTVLFAAATWWSGDPARAPGLIWRPYLSALWVTLLMGTTPLDDVLGAAARFGAPRLVLEVMHFTWRYAGVISQQAWHLRTAALARGGQRSFSISASSVAVLFASSYARAGRIHRALLSRGAGGLR